VNESCRKANVPFYACDTHGYYAFFFTDLNQHRFAHEYAWLALLNSIGNRPLESLTSHRMVIGWMDGWMDSMPVSSASKRQKTNTASHIDGQGAIVIDDDEGTLDADNGTASHDASISNKVPEEHEHLSCPSLAHTLTVRWNDRAYRRITKLVPVLLGSLSSSRGALLDTTL